MNVLITCDQIKETEKHYKRLAFNLYVDRISELVILLFINCLTYSLINRFYWMQYVIKTNTIKVELNQNLMKIMKNVFSK